MFNVKAVIDSRRPSIVEAGNFWRADLADAVHLYFWLGRPARPASLVRSYARSWKRLERKLWG